MKDVKFQIDRAHKAPLTMGESYPHCGIRAYQSESGEQWGQKEDSTDFQREKHGSCKWSRTRMGRRAVG